MNCKYKVKIKRIQYNYRVQMAQLQGKYKFNIFCTGYNDSEIKEKINTMYEAWPKVSGEGETVSLSNTVTAPVTIDLKGNTSQEGTPTPEAPQDIHVVSGDNSIKVAGKNLFDISTITLNKTIDLANGNVNVDASNRNTSDFILVTSSVTYSCNVTMTRIAYYDENKTFISSSGTTTSIVTPNNCKYVRFSYNNSLSNIQFERGYSSSFTPYATSYPINLGNIELCKIGDYQDLIFKNILESEYYDSTLESGKWYKYAKVGKVDLSTLTWDDYNHSTVGYRRYVTTEVPNIKYVTSNTQLGNGLTTKYKIHTGSGMSGVGSENCFAIDVSVFQVAAESSPTGYLYYVLENPTYTEITDSTLISQLEAIAGAEGYTGQTNISQTNSDKPFIITATTLKDLSSL